MYKKIQEISFNMLKLKFIVFMSILFTFILHNHNAYSAENENAYTKALNADLVKNSTGNLIPSVTFGLQGGGFIHTGDTYDIGNGGGVGFNIKYNANKYIATLIQLNYTYASYKPYANTSHFFDTRFLLVFQKETEQNKNGFVPWAGFGVSFNTGVMSVLNNYTTISGYGLGFILSGGFRYNIQKIYVGANIEYNMAFLNTNLVNYYGRSFEVDPSGVRINGEIGFRF